MRDPECLRTCVMSHIAAVERKDHLERGIFPLLPALIILVISRKIIIAPSELRRILAVEENLSKKTSHVM